MIRLSYFLLPVIMKFFLYVFESNFLSSQLLFCFSEVFVQFATEDRNKSLD
ncbi:MAG: hypothetical protein QXI09_00635 [Candidatus Aenigmatarchaeota archaeon]